jgi:hypothetical protein
MIGFSHRGSGIGAHTEMSRRLKPARLRLFLQDWKACGEQAAKTKEDKTDSKKEDSAEQAARPKEERTGNKPEKRPEGEHFETEPQAAPQEEARSRTSPGSRLQTGDGRTEAMPKKPEKKDAA